MARFEINVDTINEQVRQLKSSVNNYKSDYYDYYNNINKIDGAWNDNNTSGFMQVLSKDNQEIIENMQSIIECSNATSDFITSLSNTLSSKLQVGKIGRVKYDSNYINGIIDNTNNAIELLNTSASQLSYLPIPPMFKRRDLITLLENNLRIISNNLTIPSLNFEYIRNDIEKMLENSRIRINKVQIQPINTRRINYRWKVQSANLKAADEKTTKYNNEINNASNINIIASNINDSFKQATYQVNANNSDIKTDNYDNVFVNREVTTDNSNMANTKKYDNYYVNGEINNGISNEINSEQYDNYSINREVKDNHSIDIDSNDINKNVYTNTGIVNDNINSSVDNHINNNYNNPDYNHYNANTNVQNIENLNINGNVNYKSTLNNNNININTNNIDEHSNLKSTNISDINLNIENNSINHGPSEMGADVSSFSNNINVSNINHGASDSNVNVQDFNSNINISNVNKSSTTNPVNIDDIFNSTN